jgi:glycosyltransferase involved in cell wall biosynthesis
MKEAFPMSGPHMDEAYSQHASRGSVEISVVLPCFNEAECVAELTAELNTVLDRLGTASEILFVNDASTDHTLDVLRDLQQRYPRVGILNHQQRLGQSAGHASGFRFARGMYIVTMDADGQNDPSDIPHLLAALEGADAVCGIRRRRQDAWLKRMSSLLANRFRNAMTREQIADAGCAYRALRRSALVEMPVFNGMHRFLPTLLRMQGYRVVEIDVNHRPRHAGVSKYGINNRLWRGLIDCIAIRWLQSRAVPGHRVMSAGSVPRSQTTQTESTTQT